MKPAPKFSLEERKVEREGKNTLRGRLKEQNLLVVLG